MSKKSLLALMAAVMSPSFSVDLGISFSYTFSGMPDDASPSKRGGGDETRREEKPSKMTGFFRWLGGLVSNPATGKSVIPNFGQTSPQPP